MKSATKAHFKDKYHEFIDDDERRRLYERESLAFDATEMISHLMAETNVNKAELARRIGKTRAYVTQLLSGSRNLTVHTLADLAFALGYRLELKAITCRRNSADADHHSDYAQDVQLQDRVQPSV
jgi:transcriptional regulator with XRE-family HTH domain